MAMRVDVVIPCWGSYVSTLPRCLASLPADAHVIVVGDGPSCTLGLEYGADTVLIAAPVHVGAARERGRELVSGEAVCFLDADDYFLAGSLDLMLVALEADASLVAVSSFLQRSSNNSQWPPRRLARLAVRRFGGPTLLFQNVLASVGPCVIRRSAVEGALLFPEVDDEDWHATIAIRARGAVRFLELPAVRYDTSPGSLSRRTRDEGAMKHSQRRLLSTALENSRGPLITWRLADFLARPHRRRSRRARVLAWEGIAPR